ncbi:MAG: nitroreductase family protein [Desulfofustis sp.]
MMNGLLKEIDERRARRALKSEKIDDAAVQRIMTAATYAPSCFNSQPWRFMVVSEGEALARLHESLSAGNYWAKKAPLMIVLATKMEFDAKLSDNRDYALFGCGLAAANLMLQATNEGLYAHPMAGFDPLVVKEAFGIPDEYIIITLIAVGYPGSLEGLSDKHVASEKSERSRKPEAEVICRQQWSFA